MKFDPWLNLEKDQTLGVRVKGDVNGEFLNLRIKSLDHFSMDARESILYILILQDGNILNWFRLSHLRFNSSPLAAKSKISNSS